MAALAKLQTLTSDQAKLDELRAEVEAAAEPAEEAASAAAEPVIEELTADDIPTLEVSLDETSIDEGPVAAVPLAEAPAAAAKIAAAAPPVAAEIPVPTEPAPLVYESSSEPDPGVLKEFVSDLESSSGRWLLARCSRRSGRIARCLSVTHAATTQAARERSLQPHTPSPQWWKKRPRFWESLWPTSKPRLGKTS